MRSATWAPPAPPAPYARSVTHRVVQQHLLGWFSSWWRRSAFPMVSSLPRSEVSRPNIIPALAKRTGDPPIGSRSPQPRANVTRRRSPSSQHRHSEFEAVRASGYRFCPRLPAFHDDALPGAAFRRLSNSSFHGLLAQHVLQLADLLHCVGQCRSRTPQLHQR